MPAPLDQRDLEASAAKGERRQGATETRADNGDVGVDVLGHDSFRFIRLNNV
jgi:hypothetical protein